jgi:serine O-acetyltransferase
VLRMAARVGHGVLCWPLFLAYSLAHRQRWLIDADVVRWAEVAHMRGGSRLRLMLLLTNPVFRALFFHRLKRDSLLSNVLARTLACLFRPVPTLLIFTRDIGPGFYIQHGIATIIAARRIGANCWVNQQVTIGYTNDTDAPVLGNNITVYCGAKVLGAVTVGDNVKIGANAVVVKDVPSDCTVVGVPARIVRRNGIRVQEQP